jgi:hypothetical protein
MSRRDRRGIVLIAAAAWLTILTACGGPPTEKGVCITAFMLADDEFDASDPEAATGWAEDARDLIEGSRLQAEAGSTAFSGLADKLETGVEMLEADPAAETIAYPYLSEAMNGYLAYCEPFADNYYGGAP